MTTPLVQAIALAILNSDRIAGGWTPVESRDGIPDSGGYVRNATAALAAIREAGFAVVPVAPTEAMERDGAQEYAMTFQRPMIAEANAKAIYARMIQARKVRA